MANRILVAALFIASCIFHCESSEARWAKPEEADYSAENRVRDIKIHKDGTYEEWGEDEILIQKEGARSSQGAVTIQYNPEATEVQILQAETRNGSRRFKVDLKHIEDKWMASTGQGFDRNRQILIAFPNVEVGSRVYLKWKKVWKKVIVPGFFSNVFYFSGEYQKAGHLKITSSLPLHDEVVDSEGALEVTRGRDGSGNWTLAAKMKRPMIRYAVDENDPQIPLSQYPAVHVSSSQDWTTISDKMGPQYEAVLTEKLPPSFEAIAERAKALTDPVAQANAVTAALADELRYMGDWSSLKGGWVPRKLSVISKSRFGDCKDMSASTAAILRKLGYEADIAWTYRGIPARRGASHRLPNHWNFNHAIVRAKKGDRIFWLDPTNPASYAQGIPEDIHDRPALVILGGKKGRLENTPTIAAEAFSGSNTQNIDLSDPGVMSVQGSIVAESGFAYYWHNWNQNTSPESLRYNLIRSIAGHDNFRDAQLAGFEIKSRIPTDLKGEYGYKDQSSIRKTTAGELFEVPMPPGVPRLLFAVQGRVSDVHLGAPFQYRKVYRLTNIEPVGSESLDCSVETDHFAVARKMTHLAGAMVVEDVYRQKKTWISSEEYSRPEFVLAQSKLSQCFQGVGVILRRKSVVRP